MVTKLEVYNIAVRYLGAVKLHPTNGLTEDRKDRRALDGVYDQSLAIMLSSGLWHYAIRKRYMTADPDITPAFGRPYAYPHPDDYVALVKLSNDEHFAYELNDFENDNNVITTNVAEIYCAYVSDDAAWGGDLGKMPPLFVEAWGCKMAEMTGLPVTGSRNEEGALDQIFRDRLNQAKVKDAIDQRVQFKPPGRWTQSRGRRGSQVWFNGGRMGWRG